MAEREGRPVRLLIVPAADAFSAIAQTAYRPHSSEIAMGESAKVTNREQARLLSDEIKATVNALLAEQAREARKQR